MPFNIQGPELIVLLIIALLVLGPGKLPEVGSALGKSIREFRKAATDVKEAASVEPLKTATTDARPAAPAVTAAPAAPAATTPVPAPSGAADPSPAPAAEPAPPAAPAAPTSPDSDSTR